MGDAGDRVDLHSLAAPVGMRRAGKIDASQPGIVEALQAAGCSIQSLAGLGKGVPDVLATRAGQVFLFECKTPKASKHKETEAKQKTWAERMGITVHVVSTPEQAVAVLLHRPLESFGVDIDAVHRK